MKYVFLISNPVAAITAFEYITRCGHIGVSNAEIIYFRNHTYSILDSLNVHTIKRTFIHRFARHYGVFSSFPVTIRKYIETLSNEFHLYSSWLDPVASEVIKSPYCVRHSYIEEGELSYKAVPVVSFNSSYRQPVETGNLSLRFDHYWRDDAVEWISIFADAFPSAPACRRYVLGGLDAVREHYRPSLQTGQTVLLMPTPGRIPLRFIESAIEVLVRHMDGAGYLKLHPGFYENRRYLNQVLSVLSYDKFANISVLPASVILEAEMLFSKLSFIGDRSSVLIYADKLGSNVIRIPFLFGEPY